MIDGEVARLPGKYREPIILHYLQGLTTLETADALGCPHGTVLTRLARGRAKLKNRMTRRGVTLSILLSSATAADAIPRALCESTERLMALAATGGLKNAVISTAVLTITSGAMKTMFWTKCALTIGLLVAVGSVGAGATWVALAMPKEQDPLIQHANEQLQPKELDQQDGFAIPRFDDSKIDQFLRSKQLSDEERRIWKAKHNAVATEVEARMIEFMAGRGSMENLLDAAQRLYASEQALAPSTGKGWHPINEHRFRLMKKIFEVCDERFKARRIPIQMLKQSEYYALDAELKLEMSKRVLKQN